MTEISEILNPSQPKEDEFLGEDNLLYCSKCGTARQKRLNVLDRDYLVRCLCRCQAEKAQQEEEARKAAELRDRIARNRSLGIADAALRSATFANDKYGSAEMEIAKNYVNHFDQMRQEGTGLLLWGSVGTGKTYIAACIANALLDRAVPVMMTSFGRILAGMPSVASGEQSRYIDSFNTYDLLVIDDLGVERSTEYAVEQVYNVVDARYRAKLPLVVTTNRKLSELKDPEIIEKQRIYDRILERCAPVKVDGRHIRGENRDRMRREAKALLT